MRNMECFLSHLSFSWATGRELIHDLDGMFGLEGVIGLCGPNGCGKTTLLSLLAGSLRPTSGSIRLSSGGVVLVAQRQEDLEVSPGQGQRRRLGRALCDEEGLLLLDEPTNHLDAEGLGELERRLRRRRSPTLVVSHDRDFLDRICVRTWWLEDGRLVVTQGGFSNAWKAREDRIEGLLARRQAQDANRRAIRSRLQEARESAQAAERHRTAGRRMKDANDRDATSMAADFKFRTAQRRKGQDVDRLRGALERLESENVIEVKRDTLRDFRFPWDKDLSARRLSLPAGMVAALDGSEIRHGGVVVDGRMRVRLAGANGAGKTTLLAALAALGKAGVAYLPQEPSQEQDAALLRSLREANCALLGRVTSLAAVLGASGEAIVSTIQPSPGEARKLRLASMLASSSWLLLLDEPTNHLDAASIQKLQEALERWPGAVVMTTHDDRLAKAITSQTWIVREGRLQQG